MAEARWPSASVDSKGTAARVEHTVEKGWTLAVHERRSLLQSSLRFQHRDIGRAICMQSEGRLELVDLSQQGKASLTCADGQCVASERSPRRGPGERATARVRTTCCMCESEGVGDALRELSAV
eukprot:1538898-Prymnesium_polylepis.1